jgi:hypothetical protein
MARGTYILQAAMIVLAGTAAALALTLLAPFIGPAIAIIGLIALVDELHAMFSGGKSVIGDWLDQLGGKGTTDAFVQRVRGWVEAVRELQNELPDVIGSWEILAGAIDDVGWAIDRLLSKMGNSLLAPLRAPVQAFDNANKKLFGWMFTEKGKALHAGEHHDKPWWETPDPVEHSRAFGEGGMNIGGSETIAGGMAIRRRERDNRIRREYEERVRERDLRRANRAADRERDKEHASMSVDPGEHEELGMSIAPDDPSVVSFGKARVAAPPSASQSQLAPPAPMSVVVNQGANNIVINGGDPRETRRVVQDVLDERTNAAFNAIPNQSGG